MWLRSPSLVVRASTDRWPPEHLASYRLKIPGNIQARQPRGSRKSPCLIARHSITREPTSNHAKTSPTWATVVARRFS